MAEKYKNVGELSEHLLAGCLDVMEWPGNYELLKERLQLMLALWRTNDISIRIMNQVVKEAKPLPVKYHEYVINEMQYEYRYAKTFGKPDEAKEQSILDIWASRLEKRFPPPMVNDFIETLKANRLKRLRN